MKYTRALLLLLTLLLFWHSGVQARHDGFYMNRIGSEKIVAPLDWRQQGQPPLRVLVITTRDGARDVVELGLRMPLQREVVVSYNSRDLSHNSPYEATLIGNSRYEKEAELREKAQKPYQVILLGNVSLTALPFDVQCQLLQQVREGAGLISVNQTIPYRKLMATALSSPAFLEEAALPDGVLARNLRTCQFGEGRILHVNVDSRLQFLPGFDSGYAWWGRYENAQLFLIRALRWAARTESPVELRSREPLASAGEVVLAQVPDAVAVTLRLRGEDNRTLAELPLTGGRGVLPALPNGTYYVDFLAADGNVASQKLVCASPLGEVQMVLPQGDSYEAGADIPVRVSWTRQPETPLSATAELVGLPQQQVWHRQFFPAGTAAPGRASAELLLQNISVPVLAAELVLRWQNSAGEAVAQTRQTLFFPKRQLPDYFQLGWDSPRNPLYARQLVDHLGFSMGLNHPSPSGNHNQALLNSQIVPYLTRILIGRGPQGEVMQRMLHQLSSKELQEAYAALGDDQSFARPEVRELVVRQTEYRMRDLAKYGPPLYSLGDENGNNTSSGYGPSDLQGFRAFVRGKYVQIAHLNREWRADYADFDAVPHLPLEEALKAGNPAAWNDHLEYMERMYADIHHLYADEIRKHDPHARVGLEGTFGGDNFEQMMEKLDWWGPYSNLVEDEVLRSLFPQVPRFLWAGYHRERGPDKYPLLTRFLLRGAVNGNGWYSTYVQDSHSIVGVDYAAAYPQHYMAELQRLRFGLAQLLVNNPLTPSGLLVYWSHLSRRGDKVDARCVTPESGISPLLRFCYRNGLSLEFVSSRTLSRLADNKVLLLLGVSSLSDAEAKAILDFARGGGTVIADLHPAVLNEYMNRRRENPLRELFGDLVLAEAPPPLAIKPLAVTLADGTVFKADKALQHPTDALMQVRPYGRGQGILLNFNFAIVESSADPALPLGGFLDKVLRQHGVGNSYQLDREADFRVRRGAGFELLGVRGQDADVQAGAAFTIRLPQSRFVYECGRGLVGEVDRIAARYAGQSLYLYSCFGEAQRPPQVNMPARVALGSVVPLDFRGLPSGRVLSLRVQGPNGEELPERGLVLDTARKTEAQLQFAWNDQPGTYRLTLQDVTTGLQQELALELY